VSVFGASPPAPAQQAPRAAVAKPSLSFSQNALSAGRQEPVQPEGVQLMQTSPQATRPAPAPSPISAEAAPLPPSPPASADSISSSPIAGMSAARITPKAPERTPQTWLEDIRKLVAEGKLEQADREIADFKKRYPDFALPNDLR
jgi:hypothetical protein